MQSLTGFAAVPASVVSRQLRDLRVVGAVLVSCGLACGLCSCAAGVIGAAIGAAAGGGGGGSGNPPSGIVKELEIASDFGFCTQRDDIQFDFSSVQSVIGLDDVVKSQNVSFSFELEISRPAGPNAEIDLTVEVTRAGEAIARRVLSGVRPGPQIFSVSLPSEVGVGSTENLVLRVSPETGTSDDKPFRVNKGRPEVTSELVDSVSTVSDVAEFRYALGAAGDPAKQDYQFVIYEDEPRRGFAYLATPDELEIQIDQNELIVRWDSGSSQFAGRSADVFPFLVIRDRTDPLVAGFVAPGACQPTRIDNTRPRISFDLIESDPPGVDPETGDLVGQVLVEYRVVDEGSEPFDLDLAVEIPGRSVRLSSLDGSLSEVGPANGFSDGVRSLGSSPRGETYRFVWNSDADIDRLAREGELGSVAVGRIDVVARVRGPAGLSSEEIRETTLLNNELVHTVAGLRAGLISPGQNGVPAEEITFQAVRSIATGQSRSMLYLADTGTNTLWRMPFVEEPDFLERVAGGTGLRSDRVEPRIGFASASRLNGPVDVVVDEDAGELFLLESSGVLSGIIEATDRYIPLLTFNVLNGPSALALERVAGRRFLYIADSRNCRLVRYEVPDDLETVRRLDDPERTQVVFGEFRTLRPADQLGDAYPSERDGCTADGTDDEVADCPPRNARAPDGIAVWSARDGSRYLFFSEPLAREGGEPRGRIRMLSLGTDREVERIPDDAPMVLVGRGGGNCPFPELISQPRNLRVIGDDLYIICDGIRIIGQVSRGVIFRAPIEFDTRPRVSLDQFEPLAGILDRPDVSCGCSSGRRSNYDPESEGSSSLEVVLANPRGLVLDTEDRVHFSDVFNTRIRRRTVDGRLFTYIGGTVEGKSDGEEFFDVGSARVGADGVVTNFRSDEVAIRSKFASVFGLAFIDPVTLLVADQKNLRIRWLDLRTGTIATIAGRAPTSREVERCIRFAGEGGKATEARFGRPRSIAADPPYRPTSGQDSSFWLDSDRRIYFVAGDRVLKIAADGTLTTFIGSGFREDQTGLCDDVVPAEPIDTDNGDLARNAADPRRVFIKSPRGLTVDSRGRVFVADCRQRVLMVDREGIRAKRVIGVGRSRLSLLPGDTDYVRSCTVNNPDSPDDLTNDAGVGDGGDALAAILASPAELAFDAEEEFLYIADSRHNRIRRARYFGEGEFDDVRFGTIETVAGRGDTRFRLPVRDTGPAREFGFSLPVGLALNLETEELFFGTQNGSRLYRVRLQDGEVSNVAGGTTRGASGDGGEPSEARLNAPATLAVDALGNVFVGEESNHSVRRFTAAP